jgi:ligand-binding sensor domain-containing protein
VIANPPDIVSSIILVITLTIPARALKAILVASIYNDSKGNIWIGTWGGGVDKFNGQTFSNYSIYRDL